MRVQHVGHKGMLRHKAQMSSSKLDPSLTQGYGQYYVKYRGIYFCLETQHLFCHK